MPRPFPILATLHWTHSLSTRAAQLGLLAIVALAATVVSVAVAGEIGEPEPQVAQASWRGLVGGPRPEVPVGQRMIVVLRTPSLADRVAAAGGRASEAEHFRWHAAAQAAQQQLIARVGAAGLRLRPEFSYSRVLSGFSAPLDARAISLLQRFPEVEGVYPVRIAYPASLSTELVEPHSVAAGSGYRARVSLPGATGQGVTVALVDTGVQYGHDYLTGAVLEGVDVLERDDLAAAKAKPDEPSELERHATQLAGLIVGSGGPGGLDGIARNATVLPIRVGGWQRDVVGRWAVYSRTDQLIAGLERAVDPDGDGNAHDAARVALLGFAEPYAAFADSPASRAVNGALELDTLVVTPAGNDGPAGPVYGSVSGPGGGPAALTVGAADLRREVEQVRVTLRSGLRVLFDREVPLAGAVRPRRPLRLELGVPDLRDTVLPPDVLGGRTTSLTIDDFFDRRGYSRVAGKAALTPAGEAPDAAAAGAARAGAEACVLYGTSVPAGSLGLDQRIGVPVVSVPADAARLARELIGRGEEATVEIGTPRTRRNPEVGRPAAFSSRGLAFNGGLKPELVAPGIGLLTSHPGRASDGSPAFGTVSGSSAAAAVVAAAAALLAQTRPELDAGALKGALVGTATREGLLDLGAASAVEVVAEPATLALGQAPRRGWSGTSRFVVRNLSPRRLRVNISVGRLGEVGGLALAVSPAAVTLPPRGQERVFLAGRLAYVPPGDRTVTAALELRAGGGASVKVPWTIIVGRTQGGLLGGVRLSTDRFRPSDSAPALLELRAGRLVERAGVSEVLPVSHLDLELWRGEERMGLLSRLRNLLPGRYTFGLTGRGPRGRQLNPGRYRLRLLAYPPGDGRPSRQNVEFTIR
jgi:subtilisin family serine protease